MERGFKMSTIQILILAGYITGIWLLKDKIEKLDKDYKIYELIGYKIGGYIVILLWPVWVMIGIVMGFNKSRQSKGKDE